MLTYNIQLADFDEDQVVDRGPIDRRGALKALAEFPFKDEMAKLKARGDGCAPTISFVDKMQDSLFAVWLDESNKFTIECRLRKRGFSLQQHTEDLETIQKSLGFFIDNNWESLCETLGVRPSSFEIPPQVTFVLFLEAVVAFVTLGTYRLRPSIANFILDSPGEWELFVYQFVFLNIVGAVFLAIFFRFSNKRAAGLTGR